MDVLYPVMLLYGGKYYDDILVNLDLVSEIRRRCGWTTDVDPGLMHVR
jgi:hypothetical protein